MRQRKPTISPVPSPPKVVCEPLGAPAEKKKTYPWAEIIMSIFPSQSNAEKDGVKQVIHGTMQPKGVTR